MKITPLDIKNKEFKKRLIGYDIKEVNLFLETVSEEFEELVRENVRLKQALEKLKKEAEILKKNEKMFRENMINLERFMRNIKENAEKEAEIIISQAELQAEKILGSAQSRLENIRKEIEEYKIEKARLINSLRSILENHLKLLEVKMEEDKEIEELEDKIKFIKRGEG